MPFSASFKTFEIHSYLSKRLDTIFEAFSVSVFVSERGNLFKSFNLIFPLTCKKLKISRAGLSWISVRDAVVPSVPYFIVYETAET